MPRRVSIRKVDSSSFYVHEAYDARDNLIATDIQVNTESDLEDLKDQNVRYVILSPSESEEFPEESPPDTPADPSPPDSPDTTSPDPADVDWMTEENEVSVQATRETYREMLNRMESIYNDFHQGMGNLDALEELKPLLEDFLQYVRESPASISILTQIEDYDDITFNHSINTCVFSILYGDYRGFGEEDLFELAFGALLHDLGKTQLPREILQKEGTLTPGEFEKVQRHPEEGRRLLKRFDTSSVAWKIAYEHHERPDGSGYPEGVRDIHPYSRIVSVIDVYEALTAPRPYKASMLPAKAFLTMKEEFYDHEETRNIWNTLVSCMGLFSVGSFVLLSNGLIGIVEKNNLDDLANPVVKIIFNRDRERLDYPVQVDLAETNDQHYTVQGEVFDDSTRVEKAISLDRFSHLKEKVRNMIKNRELSLEG